MEYSNDLQNLKDFRQSNRFMFLQFQGVVNIKSPLSYILENKQINLKDNQHWFKLFILIDTGDRNLFR